jgi:hypothetical protein
MYILALSFMTFIGIDDMFCMSIHEIHWVIMHCLLLLINWKVIFILPFYYICKKWKFIGIGDWIVIVAAILISNNYYLCFLISYVFSIAFIDIKERKSPLILPITLGVICTTDYLTIGMIT